MWQYNRYVSHADSRTNFKYIAKVEKNGETRYFYTQPEYNKYLNGTKKKFTFSGFMKSVIGIIKKTPIDEAVVASAKQIKKSIAFINKASKQTVSDIKKRITPPPKEAPRPAPRYSRFEKAEEKIAKERKYFKKITLPNGVRYFYTDKEYRSYLKRAEYQKNEPDFMKNVQERLDIPDEDMDMAQVNEKYPDGIEYQKNCVNSTTAYELRRRGYDVEAAANTKGYYMKEIKNWFKDPKINTLSKKDSKNTKAIIKSILEDSGPDSRGYLGVQWEGGGGHSLVYEVNSDKQITIRDCQTNLYVNMSELATSITRLEHVRTDNLELKKEVLKLVTTN